MPFKLPQWSEGLLPRSRARILATENGSQGLPDQFAARSTLSLGSTIYLFEEFIGKRNHHFGHYDLTSENSIATGPSKGNTFYIPAQFRFFRFLAVVFNAEMFYRISCVSSFSVSAKISTWVDGQKKDLGGVEGWLIKGYELPGW
jgi:hypothetical protein